MERLAEVPDDSEDCPVCGGWNVPSKHRPYCSAGCAYEATHIGEQTVVPGHMSNEDWAQFRHARR